MRSASSPSVCRRRTSRPIARMDSNRVAENFYRAHPDWICVDANGTEDDNSWFSPHDSSLTFGLGGIHVEMFRDVARRLSRPVHRSE